MDPSLCVGVWEGQARGPAEGRIVLPWRFPNASFESGWASRLSDPGAEPGRWVCPARRPPLSRFPTPSMAKLKLDLHDIFNRGREIDAELDRVMREAVDRKIPMVEIIPGKGSGQLKKRVLRYLQQGHVKALYHRVEKDSKNHGRLFVHFRHGK